MSHPFSKNCGPAFMRRARITPRKPYRSALPAAVLAFASRLSATPRIIRHAAFLSRSGRVRMAEARFAVVRLGSLGDIVHTFPTVAALHESFPQANIVWLTHPRWVELVESSGLATEIWQVDSR